MRPIALVSLNLDFFDIEFQICIWLFSLDHFGGEIIKRLSLRLDTTSENVCPLVWTFGMVL